MAVEIVHVIDIALWCITALSVGYIFFYALTYALVPTHRVKGQSNKSTIEQRSFLVIFPAYGEDIVILHTISSFLNQHYPQDKYSIVVVSDHMSEETNAKLSELPISLLQPQFEKSSKAKALQFAFDNTKDNYDNIVILDADNVVKPDFLERLNHICDQGFTAIQCHRCAKNANNNIARLDGISEEINNSLFRMGHNNIGMSSALIGSGMCFNFDWFKTHVHLLSTAGEDREIEKMLLIEHIFIKYAADIDVYDEKVGNEENFQRQRQRWMSAQLNSLLSMMENLPKSIIELNINYIDKTIQQMLIPRSMLLIGTFIWSLIMSVIALTWALKWWLLFILTSLSLWIAIPRKMRNGTLAKLITHLPRLTWKMLSNIRHIDRKNREFIHTTHE